MTIKVKISSAMMPDSGETLPSHFGRTTKRRTNRPAIETATSNGPHRHEAEIEFAEAAVAAKEIAGRTRWRYG